MKAAIAMMMLLVPCPMSACSAVACIDSGPEFSRDFLVLLKHEGKPLQGATVEITPNTGESVGHRYSGVTGSDGAVRVTDLAPGEYWLTAELMGVSAADHCFHVAQRTSRRAKQRATYEWGEFAFTTVRVAGNLVDSQPGTGETPLWNLVHRVKVPIVGSTLKLQDPFTGAVFIAKSDADGAFGFDNTPNGLYVLHVEGGRSNRDFDAADELIRVTPTAKGSKFVLTKSDPGGGSCGGTLLEPATSR